MSLQKEDAAPDAMAGLGTTTRAVPRARQPANSLPPLPPPARAQQHPHASWRGYRASHPDNHTGCLHPARRLFVRAPPPRRASRIGLGLGIASRHDSPALVSPRRVGDGRGGMRFAWGITAYASCRGDAALTYRRPPAHRRECFAFASRVGVQGQGFSSSLASTRARAPGADHAHGLMSLEPVQEEQQGARHERTRQRQQGDRACNQRSPTPGP